VNGTRGHSAGRERGAALIVAIGVLTLLLVIALTFFRASIGDVRTSQNTVDGVRAELLADGATAVAIAFLNHDRYIHPTYTSLDFAWRTYFNGTFAAGKPHLWAPVQDPILSNGVHRMSLLRSRVPDVNGVLVDRAGIIEIDRRLITPETLGNALYIPRVDFDYFPTLGDFAQATPPANYVTLDADGELQNPFILTADLADPTNPRKFSPLLEEIINDPRLFGTVTFQADRDALQATVYDAVAPNGRVIRLFNDGDPDDRSDETLPYEQVHVLTDVDNDGDGLNDSMWLPVGADRYYPEDGLDNDLDGFRDALGADGIPDSGDEDIDGEPGVFLYRGDTDGIDNDGDGVVDEDDEFNYVVFTVPMPWSVDLDGNGTLDRLVPTAAELQRMGITNTDIVRFEGDVNPSTLERIEIGYGRTGNYIYSRDNDYDLVLDGPVDASHYMFTPDVIAAITDTVNNPGCRADFACVPYGFLLRNLFAPEPGTGDAEMFNVDGTLALIGVIQGETMTELTGRMAILITDESSKVNINAAGGWQYPLFPDPLSPLSPGPLLGLNSNEASVNTTPLQRSFADGLGPHEFDTRVVPDIGHNRARWMWQYLMGARQGFYAQDFTDNGPPNQTYNLARFEFELEGDATLPGYGYVDDNANLLQLALSRKNNRGGPNYVVDDSIFRDATVDLGLDGDKWDGIDEPDEYQSFRPYRNLVAEDTVGPAPGIDDDADDIVNEVGELGDQYYRTHQQLKLIDVGDSNGFARGLNNENVFNAVRNYFTAHSSDRNERHFHQDSVLALFRDAQSRQTTGQRKDLNLTRAGDLARTVKRDWTFPASVAEAWTTSGGALATRAGVLTFGEGVPGVSLMPDGGFTVEFLRGLRQENMSVLSDGPIMGYDEAETFALLADAELRVHQTAATLKDFADLDFTRSIDDQILLDDDWWRRVAVVAAAADPGNVDLAAAAQLAQTQRIYYTTAGLEAIRINEVMVRPVRRFEAEAITNMDVNDAANTDIRGLYPNRFVPTGLLLPATYTPEERREEQGFRSRVLTTTDAVDAYNARATDNVTVIVANPTTDSGAAPTGRRWDLRPLFDRDGTVATDAGLLGLEAAWATYRRYLTLTDPDQPDSRFAVPDVVQFSFQATDGLPAGRYYVTVNTQWVDEGSGEVQESVFDEDDFMFAVKTGTLEQDWFADVMNIEAYVTGAEIYQQAWRTPALLGSAALGGSAGMAFLQGDAAFRFNVNAPVGNPFTTTIAGFDQNNILDRNLGFTIEIPERAVPPLPPDPPLAPEDDQWIHIAFRRGIGTEDNRAFVVNYLEFSQEPDHEWLEIVNQSDDVVDLSGWQVAVESHPLGLGPMTVPAGTLIAPRGMLLLGTNKFDYGYNWDANLGVNGEAALVEPLIGDSALDPDLFDRGVGFFANGIGLVDSALELQIAAGIPAIQIFRGVTVPQILYGLPFPGNPLQGSVFEGWVPDRTVPPGAPIISIQFVDYVDRDGDGVRDDPALDPEAAVISTPFGLLARSSPTILSTGADPGVKPWDRIVELIVPDLSPQTPGTNFDAADVGRIVLGGGIFPNRPEFDATDNDGDNRYLAFDGIDNDGDGDIDEDFEGFNEGRFAREEYLAAGAPVPGAFNEDVVRFNSLFFDFDVTNPALPGEPDFWTGGVDAFGLATPNPPQWKEFMERRNFPGENVIVTLYEGPASDARVADRITYTQRDVDNRQIDDTIFVTDFDVDLNTLPPNNTPFGDPGVNIGDVGVQIPLDERFESFWPENTMGQDFARSLERKHPDYTGDRFGTQNRFQATDGNYDDWSESTGRWERETSFDASGVFQNTILVDRIDNPAFSHVLGGTPLRRNVSARIAEHTPADFTQFPPAERASTFATVTFRNRPLVSPGDALTMPHTSRRQVLSSVTRNPGTLEDYLIDLASPNISLAGGGPVGRGDSSYDSVTMGQTFDDSPVRNAINFFHEVRAFIGDLGTTDSIALNVGQANVIQVARPGDTDPPSDFLGRRNWIVASGRPPQVWAPLMMFSLPDDAANVPPYGYEPQYLFQPLATLPATVDTTRWPMPLRSAVYASSNFAVPDFANPIDGAQAVFVWDGDDGLENGEYDLYVVTTEDLSLLARADLAMILDDPSDPNDPFDTRLLTDNGNLFGGQAGVGAPFVAAAGATANNEVFLDIEVFRDSNGDRKAWVPDLLPGDFLNDTDFHRGVGFPAESFGVMRNVQPDADGVIRYGNVRVENNFLAVSIRNRSASGTVARVSRVILAARGKTPGRININTVETKRIDTYDPNSATTPSNPVDTSSYVYFYNPLTGLPGVLDRFADANGVFPVDMIANPGGVSPNSIVNDVNSTETANDESAVFMARRIVEQKLRLLREQPDGRYYELASDLLADAHFAGVSDHPGTVAANDVALHPSLIVEYDNYLPDVNNDGIVDTNAVRAGALREAAFRFGKMQNLITVKGEVFEILVTVQSGYGTDADGDGRINWRDDREFTSMAEKTARTIYER